MAMGNNSLEIAGKSQHIKQTQRDLFIWTQWIWYIPTVTIITKMQQCVTMSIVDGKMNLQQPKQLQNG